jgi:hypothetical protein
MEFGSVGSLGPRQLRCRTRSAMDDASAPIPAARRDGG